jgi:hypothetical protein
LQLTRGKSNRLAHSGLDSFAYREWAISDVRAVLPFGASGLAGPYGVGR